MPRIDSYAPEARLSGAEGVRGMYRGRPCPMTTGQIAAFIAARVNMPTIENLPAVNGLTGGEVLAIQPGGPTRSVTLNQVLALAGQGGATIVSGSIDANGHTIVLLSDGSTIDLGVLSGGGGTTPTTMIFFDGTVATFFDGTSITFAA